MASKLADLLSDVFPQWTAMGSGSTEASSATVGVPSACGGIMRR
jgi:hypothetical protein